MSGVGGVGDGDTEHFEQFSFVEAGGRDDAAYAGHDGIVSWHFDG